MAESAFRVLDIRKPSSKRLCLIYDMDCRVQFCKTGVAATGTLSSWQSFCGQ